MIIIAITTIKAITRIVIIRLQIFFFHNYLFSSFLFVLLIIATITKAKTIIPNAINSIVPLSNVTGSLTISSTVVWSTPSSAECSHILRILHLLYVFGSVSSLR